MGTSLGEMAYTSAEARQELLDAFAGAIEQIGLALAALGAAYEQLDEYNADRLEAELFGPVQRAYGRAKGAHAQFAGRHGMASRTFESPSPGIPSTGARGFIDSAVNATAEADSALSELQDSSLPTEVGDVELRAALTDVRELLGGMRQRARELERTLGR
jgi:Zn-dependent protease with chaperone function